MGKMMKTAVACLMLTLMLAGCGLPGGGLPGAGSVSPGASSGKPAGSDEGQEATEGSEGVAPQPPPAPGYPEIFSQFIGGQDDLRLQVGEEYDEGKLVEIPMKGRPRAYQAFTAQDGLIALVWGGTEAHAAVSHDNGASWAETVLPGTGGAGEYEACHIGFTSGRNGWATAYRDRLVRVYTTDDGGDSWQLAGQLQAAEPDASGWAAAGVDPGDPAYLNAYSGCVFASRDIGFITFGYASNRESLYVTYNGGHSWAPAALELWPEMLYGNAQLTAYTPRWTGDEWSLWVNVYHGENMGTSGFSFVPAAQGGGWVWDAPDWDLPAGVSAVDFNEGIPMQLPVAHDAGKGFDSEGLAEFFIICDAMFYQARAGGLKALGEGTLFMTAEQMNRYIEYQFGDPSYDSTTMESYDAGLGGFKHNHGHGGPDGVWNELKTVEAQADGTLLASFDVMGGGPGEEPYLRHSLACVFKPITTPEGAPMFTLLLSYIKA